MNRHWMALTIILYTVAFTEHYYCLSASAFVPPLLSVVPSRSTTLASKKNDAESFAWIVPDGVPFGSLDKLEFQSTIFTETTLNNQPDKNKGELCRISTRAIGLNFADIFCILGLYTAANQVRGEDSGNMAFCPGLEYAGIIVDDPTRTFSKGQRVLGFSRFGGYADIVQVPPHFVYPLPDSWSFSQGASFLVQALTAWHGLVEIGGMPNLIADNSENNGNYTVLVHSAAGGVGLWASEIAARRGATVIGVIGSLEKQKTFQDRINHISPKSRTILRGDEQTFSRRLAELLCDMHGLSTSDLPEKRGSELEYLRNDGYGVDIVMESLGGQYFTDSFEAMNREGSLVTFGSTSYVSPGLSLNKLRLIWRYLTRPRIDPGTLTARNIRLAGFNLIFLTDKPKKLRQELKDCIFCLGGYGSDGTTEHQRLLEQADAIVPLDPVTTPVIGETFDFRTDTVRALECLKNGGTVGKVVLENMKNNAS